MRHQVVSAVHEDQGRAVRAARRGLHGNPYDGHTLGPVIADLEELTGVAGAPHPRRQGLSRPQLSRPLQGLDQRLGPPGHPSRPPRDAASRRRAACDWPSQG